MKYDDIEGWFDFQEVYVDAFLKVPKNGIIVEIGSYLGKSTIFMANLIKNCNERSASINCGGSSDNNNSTRFNLHYNSKNITFCTVDHGFGNTDNASHLHEEVLSKSGGNLASQLLINLKDNDVLDYVIPILTTSVQASKLFQDSTIDFCFIDANHTYDSVKEDILSWYPKIKIGGTIGGHDYCEHFPEVIKAVDDAFNKPCGNKLKNSCWSYTKVL